jgi:Predicted transcriptional regulators
MENELKVYRAMEDITQGELAERVGVSRQAINSIETGKYDRLSNSLSNSPTSSAVR